jgi:hypothetical protein
MTLAARKSAELERKLASLDEEFGRWETESANGKDFQRHYTQIRGVLLPLRALRDRIEQDLQNKSGDTFLAEAGKATQLILGIHRIWEFFRQKLLQRQDERLRGFLEIADEFAWLCYSPVVRKTRLRRPPLVYLNGGASPFIIRRNERFQVEGDVGGSIPDADFERILEQLPFPVIGVPWHEIEYWPELVVVGHEVGHAVERDLKLTSPLNKAIGTALGAGSSRGRYWAAWRSELFADAYGCAATGPAFAAGLADFLATSRSDLETVAPSAQSDYPPALLRVIFNQSVLKARGLESELADWKYEPSRTVKPFIPEAAAVAAEFARILENIFTFSKKQWRDAKKRAEHAAAHHAPDKSSDDLRVLIASIRCSFEAAPDGWDKPSATGQSSALDQIKNDVMRLVKSEKRAASDRSSKDMDVRDERAADAIYQILAR